MFSSGVMRFTFFLGMIAVIYAECSDNNLLKFDAQTVGTISAFTPLTPSQTCPTGAFQFGPATVGAYISSSARCFGLSTCPQSSATLVLLRGVRDTNSLFAAMDFYSSTCLSSSLKYACSPTPISGTTPNRLRVRYFSDVTFDGTCSRRISADSFRCTDSVRTGTLVLPAGTKCVEISMTQTGPALFTVDDIQFCGTTVVWDPYIRPLNGDKMLLQPKGHVNGAVYNMITLPELQYNTKWVIYGDHPKFSEGEWILEAGLTLRDPATQQEYRIRIEPNMTDQEDSTGCLSVTVDGKTVAVGSSAILFRETYVTRGRCSHVTISTSMLQVTFEYADERVLQKKRENHQWPFLQTTVGVVDHAKIATAHGLLGQTARPAKRTPSARERSTENLRLGGLPICNECYMEGPITDYRLEGDDLFGTKFRFNQYKK